MTGKEIYGENLKKEDGLPQEHFFGNGKEKGTAKYQITGWCIGCGMCYGICTFSAVYRDGERFRIDEARCAGCGACYKNCPIEAIRR